MKDDARYDSVKVQEKTVTSKRRRNACHAGELCGRFEGIFWATMVGVNYAVVAVFIKFLPNVSIAEFVVYRSLAAIVFGLPLMILRLKRFVNYDRKILCLWFLISVLNLTYTGTRYTSFQMLPLGDASVIVFSTPLFTAALASLLLKEHITRLCIASLLISLVGMCLTIKLPLILSSDELGERLGTRKHLIGCGFAFASVLNSSIYAITLRRLKTVHPAINTFIQGFLSAIMGICLVPAFGGFSLAPCSITSWVIVAFCILDVLGNILYARAMQKEETTIVTNVVRSSDIFLCFLCQIVIFHEPLDFYSVSGALIVFASGILMPIQRWMQSLSDDSKWKIKFLLK